MKIDFAIEPDVEEVKEAIKMWVEKTTPHKVDRVEFLDSKLKGDSSFRVYCQIPGETAQKKVAICQPGECEK